MALNLLITGSRDYPRLGFVRQVITGLILYKHKNEDIAQMFVGDARGVDRVAADTFRDVARKEPVVFRAKWNEFGRAAGIRRNVQMIEAYQAAGGGMMLAFWDGKSPGTLHCMKAARDRNLLVLIPAEFMDVTPGEHMATASLAMRIWEGEERLS